MRPGPQGSPLTHTPHKPAVPSGHPVCLVCDENVKTWVRRKFPKSTLSKGFSAPGYQSGALRTPACSEPVGGGGGRGLSMTLGQVKALPSYLKTTRTPIQARRKNHPSIHAQRQLPSQPPAFIGSGLGGKQGPSRSLDGQTTAGLITSPAMLGHKTREAASCIPQPRAWVSNQPSFSFPRTNFSLLGCQSRTEIVGRGTYANKSRSSPHKTSHLRPRNWPERRPTVRQARPLEKGPWEEGHTPAQWSRFLPAPAPSDHVRMNENTGRVGLPAPERVWKRH